MKTIPQQFARSFLRAALFVLSITALHAGDLTSTRSNWRELHRGARISFPDADVISTWNTAIDGNWNDPTKWSSNPNFPNNGNGGVATYNAVISTTGAAYTVTLSVPITIENLLLSSASATLNHTAGTFTATNGISLNAGTYHLNGGTISNTTITPSGTGVLSVAANGNNLLTGVTVNGDLTLSDNFASTRIGGGTTFTTVHLSGANSELGFQPGQTLSGTILFEGAITSQRFVTMSSAGNFTIGATGVIRSVTVAAGGTIGGNNNFGGAMALTNQGLISSQVTGNMLVVQPETFSNTGTLQALNGGSLTIAPTRNWTNAGTISLDETSLLILGGTFNTTGGIGTFANPAGGPVSIIGTILNTGNTITFNNDTGSWMLAGGTVSGGTLAFADGKTLFIEGGNSNLLTGVTVNGGLTLSDTRARTRIGGGTTFTTAHLSGLNSELGFLPGQTLSGTILFEGATNGQRFVTMSGAGNFTIGASGVIRSATGLGVNGVIGGNNAFSGAMALTNNGLISSQVSAREIVVQPASFINQGTFEATNGGIISLPIGYTQTAGVTRVSGGGTINAINNNIRQTITISGGRLEGNGTINANVANSAIIAPGLSAGQLNISGDLTLTSTSNLQFEIGGLTPGTQYDVLTEAGTVALNLNGTLTVSLINCFSISITPGDTFTIISSNQPITGTFSNVVAGRVTTADGMGSFAVNTVGNNFILGDFQVIPEPSSLLLLSLGAGFLVLRCRRTALRRYKES
ncbi:MAG: PEP-CTERM sorting domain-containing protein [Verrucomicrobiota bacterium]|nr:PEP-CTERM sorting domain-containing protein [Verrucomicrobiota bacterium]